MKRSRTRRSAPRSASALFNQIPYRPRLRSLVRRMLGPTAFSYPAKVLRAVYPERTGSRTRGRYVHCDYAVSGVPDMLTTWFPLMVIPLSWAAWPSARRSPGSAAAAPGSRNSRTGLGQRCLPSGRCPAVSLPDPARRVAEHRAALRLPGDFRWQRPDRPAPAELILGPAPTRRLRPGARGRREMFSMLLAHQDWWAPVPAGLTLCPRARLAGRPPGPAQWFTVHPGWQRWGRAARRGALTPLPSRRAAQPRVDTMRIGFGAPVSGAWASPRDLTGFGAQAEEAGYASLWTFQRLFIPADAKMDPVYRASSTRWWPSVSWPPGRPGSGSASR